MTIASGYNQVSGGFKVRNRAKYNVSINVASPKDRIDFSWAEFTSGDEWVMRC